MKRSAWPKIIKQGAVTVRIYQAKSHGCTEYKVAHYDSEGRRKLRSFSDLADAEKFARTAAAIITKGDAKSFTITGDDCMIYFRALEFLKPIPGLSLDQVAREYVSALQQLRGRSLAGAIEYYLKRNPVTLQQKSCEEVLGELIRSKAADGASEVYLKDLRVRLSKFAKSFRTPISAVHAPMIDEWLRKLKSGPRSRNNTRRSIISLFVFAEARDYVAKGHVDFTPVQKRDEAASCLSESSGNPEASLFVFPIRTDKQIPPQKWPPLLRSGNPDSYGQKASPVTSGDVLVQTRCLARSPTRLPEFPADQKWLRSRSR